MRDDNFVMLFTAVFGLLFLHRFPIFFSVVVDLRLQSSLCDCCCCSRCFMVIVLWLWLLVAVVVVVVVVLCGCVIFVVVGVSLL